MINITDPRQTQLFDPFEHLFSPLAYKTIQNGWQGVFRHVILELLPAEIVAGEFSPAMGRPTKELYSVAGLTFIMEFQDWTKEEAAQAYMFHSDLWYALNLEPGLHSMCVRTLERYQEIFRENELAQAVMRDVTLRLVEVLELDITKQRLDSTHVFSDMATFGRTRLMGVTIKRFLTQVKRHGRAGYDALPEELLERYRPSEHQLFASATNGVALVAPVPGKTPGGGTMTIGDFEVDEETETVKACPAGHAPETSAHDPETGKTRTEMDAETCAACAQKERCPMNQTRNGCHFEHTAKERRLDERRRNETTDEFREGYNKRAGIEATNSGIKRRTGMARLRVRGKKSVFHAIIMKVAGWNLLQAARAEKMRGYVRGKMGKTKRGGQDALALRALKGYLTRKIALRARDLTATQRATLHWSLCAA